MPTPRKTVGDRLILWVLRHSDVSHVDGIGIVDLRARGDSFLPTVQRALQLVREHDPRRYARIVRHIKWIVNQVTAGKDIEYNERIRLCGVEFSEIPGLENDVLAAAYACFLVHEATHGVIASRGIKYSPQNRTRIEHLCTTEHNRFAALLATAEPARYPLELLRWDFDADQWKEAW